MSESRVLPLSQETDRTWLDYASTRPAVTPRVRLFCFPYAGASASIFRPWQGEIHPDIQVCGVQLPGRGGRFAEAPFSRLSQIVDALAENLRGALNLPFAFFGHCMGALIAFELARRLRREGREPLHLIVSALRPPQLRDPQYHLHVLPNATFVATLAALDGLPQELIQEPELLNLMLPVLRADFEACETYRYRYESPLHCPISCYTGRNDPRSTPEEMALWRDHTVATFSCRVFPGNHFFLESARKALLSALSVELLGTLIRAEHGRSFHGRGVST
jgi:medium-chain acyl-[acyl-carrier-protein] hydrolase